MAFEKEDNKAILIISIYQCCKNPTNPQGKTVYHQQETRLSERNRNNCDLRQNFYKDMCRFLQWFQKKTDKRALQILIGDWNEECIGKSHLKKLCNEFGMVNISHRKYQNMRNLKRTKMDPRSLTKVLFIKNL